MTTWQDQVLALLPPRLANGIREASRARTVREIRLRARRPVFLHAQEGEQCLAGLVATRQEIDAAFAGMVRHSVYALEPQLAKGYIALPGGHRAGLCGHMARTASGVRMGSCGSIDIRIAHQVRGCALPVIPQLTRRDMLCSTLILSPPGCGKTTLLRELVRCASDGLYGLRGQVVAVADERGELAACAGGVPQLDVGMRTDVLDGMEKAAACGMLLRGMGPQLLAMDELVSPQDWQCVQDAVGAGVTVLATAHGHCVASVCSRAGYIWRRMGAFERVVCLRPNAIGQVESVTSPREEKQKP